MCVISHTDSFLSAFLIPDFFLTAVLAISGIPYCTGRLKKNERFRIEPHISSAKFRTLPQAEVSQITSSSLISVKAATADLPCSTACRERYAFPLNMCVVRYLKILFEVQFTMLAYSIVERFINFDYTHLSLHDDFPWGNGGDSALLGWQPNDSADMYALSTMLTTNIVVHLFLGNLKNEDKVLAWLVEQKSKT